MAGRQPQRSVAARHLRLGDLRTALSVDLRPDTKERAAIAARLGASGLPKLRLSGRIAPQDGGHVLRARLGATVVQPCSITLVPVTTRIDEDVIRRYLPPHALPDVPPPGPGTEIEMPEDDTLEPAPEVLDLAEVLEEALALALPAFPRAPGAELGPAVFAAPGVIPLTDEAASPFAVLKGRAGPGPDGDEPGK
jgi:uncharacterized metal-binding protein YceD (DUF177 family)